MEGVDGRRPVDGAEAVALMESDHTFKIKNKTTMKKTRRCTDFAATARKGQWTSGRSGYGHWWGFSRR